MNPFNFWRDSTRLLAQMCARAGIQVRARIQAGKDFSTCSKCDRGFKVCHDAFIEWLSAC